MKEVFQAKKHTVKLRYHFCCATVLVILSAEISSFIFIHFKTHRQYYTGIPCFYCSFLKPRVNDSMHLKEHSNIAIHNIYNKIIQQYCNVFQPCFVEMPRFRVKKMMTALNCPGIKLPPLFLLFLCWLFSLQFEILKRKLCTLKVVREWTRVFSIRLSAVRSDYNRPLAVPEQEIN